MWSTESIVLHDKNILTCSSNGGAKKVAMMVYPLRVVGLVALLSGVGVVTALDNGVAVRSQSPISLRRFVL